MSCIQNATKNDGVYDCESNKEKTPSFPLAGDARELRQLVKVSEASLIAPKVILLYNRSLDDRYWKRERTN